MSTGILKDISLSAINAGIVTVLVGFTSSVAIVFQAAQVLGASPGQIGSWIWALCMGMGVTSLGLSLAYRMPVATAWSTAGGAMIIASASGVSLAEATGAFMLSALLIVLSGFSGFFERMMHRIPAPIAAGMLSGILLRFGLDAFLSLKSQFALCGAMFLAFVLARRFMPRYAVILALLVGIAIASGQHQLNFAGSVVHLAKPEFVAPAFSWQAVFGMAVPLYVVTMAAQNVPGLAVLRGAGYPVSVSPATGWIGVVNLVLAPFGAFALNFATITAAICVGREAHEDPAKRYMAGVFTGIAYILVGIFGATVSGAIAAMPRELVLTIAGLALLGTIGTSLATAVSDAEQRDPALIAFLVTGSGLSFAGVGAAFWGLLAGILAAVILHFRPKPFESPVANLRPNNR